MCCITTSLDNCQQKVLVWLCCTQLPPCDKLPPGFLGFDVAPNGGTGVDNGWWCFIDLRSTHLHPFLAWTVEAKSRLEMHSLNTLYLKYSFLVFSGIVRNERNTAWNSGFFVVVGVLEKYLTM
jgi:hypothetical protein